MASMSLSSDIRLGEYIARIVYLSRRIYEARNDLEKSAGNRRAGEPLQGAGRQDAPAHPRPSWQQRGLRLSHPRQPRRPATDGVASPRVSAQERARGGPPRRCVDALPGLEIAEPGDD